MLIDCVDFNIIELRHRLLRQPNVLVLVAHFNGILVTASGGHKGQILCCGGTDDGEMDSSLLFIRRFLLETIIDMDLKKSPF